jgi:two-component system sensor histidine kinase GlrK
MNAERNSAALRFPRSFLGLLIAGFLLVALPLLGTLLYSAWHTQRLTEQGRNAVFGAAKAAAASRALVNRIGSIERLALQWRYCPTRNCAPTWRARTRASASSRPRCSSSRWTRTSRLRSSAP